MSLEEYLILKRERRNWGIGIAALCLAAFALGGLLILQNTRYFQYMYQVQIIILGVGALGVMPFKGKITSTEKEHPEWKKYTKEKVAIPDRERTRRYIILGVGFVLMFISFSNSFDFEKGFQREVNAQESLTLNENLEQEEDPIVSDELINDANELLKQKIEADKALSAAAE